MAPRKRRKKAAEQELFLFSEEEKSAFPSMQDKLQLPYEETHYIKARQSLGLG